MRTWINAFCACLLLLSGLCQATETYVTYYHNDHLGSPAAATDEQGKLLWRAHYRPYGEREPHRDSAAFGTLGYTGHAQNERNGLVYAGARYYDPLVGRFLSVDPVGPQAKVPGSFNRYAYALNNPYRYIDPDGRAAFALLLLAPGIEGALVYGGVAILGTVGGAYLAEEVIQPGIDGTSKEDGTTSNNANNPYKGPINEPVVVVDKHGNAIPLEKGEQIKGSPDGDYQQVLGLEGKPTGVRLDRGGHRNQSDPAAKGPHGHRPGVTTPDGNPHLPINSR